jgi:AcrR family transcriptional regulator
MARSPRPRPYDNELRSQRADATTDDILDAAVALARSFERWDWRGLTFRAVAERAGVGERTVYRRFRNQHELHEAVMRRLETLAGVSYDGIELDDVAPVMTKMFSSVSAFRVGPSGATNPAFEAEDRRRRGALIGAVDPATQAWPAGRREAAAAMLDVLWSITTYERLVGVWGLDPDAAVAATRWAVTALIEKIRGEVDPSTT